LLLNVCYQCFYPAERDGKRAFFVLLDGDHLLCELLRHLEAEGLLLERLVRYRLGIFERLAALRQ
jgi:hypothetical protein